MKSDHHLKGESASSHSREAKLILSGLFALLLIIFLLDIFLGSVNLKPQDVIRSLFSDAETNIAAIVFKFRIPKAFTALFVGIALSISGLQMQTLFRNPMAGPYVLGISSGASLGVALVILGFSGRVTIESLHGLGTWSLVVASWLGAGAVMILIMFITLKIRDILTVLILGIMLSSGISAIVSMMQYFSNETMLKAYIIWTMGSLGNLTAHQLQVLAISIIAGIVLSFLSVKMLNALLLGENYAGSLGLNVRLARWLIFAGTSILTGSVTAFCGPIGFIGIAVPHIARIIFKTSDHKILIPATLLLGGILMMASDIISQLPGSEKVLPVNSVTSLIGIPVVVWVILRNKKYPGVF